ncbi:MAG: DUF3386 domain-containing protein [Pseudomonadota bacterium]|nr:DUF3386 domain-containing protein [Pseudomonadota bacterium]
MRCSLFSTKAWLAALILGFCGTGTGPLRAAEKAPVGPETYHLMMRAVNARATWNAVFPGFNADIKVNYKVQVLPNGKIKFTGLSEPHSQAWAGLITGSVRSYFIAWAPRNPTPNTAAFE